MRRRQLVRRSLLSFVAVVRFFCAANAIAQPPILFISGQNGTPRAVETIAAFSEAWEKAEPGVRVFSQFLAEFSFPPAPAALAAVRAAVVARLRLEPPRLIVAHGSAALDMAVALRKEAFNGCGIVGVEISQPKIVQYGDERNIRILPFADYQIDMIALALRVIRDLEIVYLMFDTGAGPIDTEAAGRRLKREFPDLDFSFILDPTPQKTDSLLRGTGHGRAVLCFSPGWFDEDGRFITGAEFIRRLTARYEVPFFGHNRDDLEAGLAGGFGLAPADWGRAAASAGLDLLHDGEAQLTVVSMRPYARPFLNYTTLERFGIEIRETPENMEVINRPPAFWIRYQRPLQASGLAMLFILVVLAVSIVLRFRIDHALRWANEKLELLVAERTVDLSTANDELRAANENLAQALHRTEAMQEAMLKGARESVLGRLAASLANEINSPLNAVASANEASMRVLRDEKDGLGSRLKAFTSAQRELFFRYADTVAAARFDFRDDQRASARQLESALRLIGDGTAAETASDLEDSGLGSLSEEELSVFTEDWAKPVLAALYRLSVIYRSGYIVSRAVDNAAAAVAEVRSYSNSMTDESDVRDFDLGASIKKALSLFSHKLTSAYVVSTTFAEQAVMRGDEAAFIRMWTHLIQNALDAMPEGGRLSLELTEEGESFRVEIGDTGTGVSPSIQDRLFEAFVTTKPAAEGLGLGLSYCKRVVEGVGGSIRYRTGDAGTIFILTLPRERKPA